MITKVKPVVLHDIHLHFLYIARDQKGLLGDKAFKSEVVLSTEHVAIVAIDASLMLCKAALLLLAQHLAHLLVVDEPVLSLASLGAVGNDMTGAATLQFQ